MNLNVSGQGCRPTGKGESGSGRDGKKKSAETRWQERQSERASDPLRDSHRRGLRWGQTDKWSDKLDTD